MWFKHNTRVQISSFGFIFFTAHFLRNFCTSDKSSKENIATYEEVKDLPNHPDILLIDVREPEELQETGKIPTSINIPRKYWVILK